jgi:hypothetical protein
MLPGTKPPALLRRGPVLNILGDCQMWHSRDWDEHEQRD